MSTATLASPTPVVTPVVTQVELLVCGLPHLDFAALQAAAAYEGGYSAGHPLMQALWSVLLVGGVGWGGVGCVWGVCDGGEGGRVGRGWCQEQQNMQGGYSAGCPPDAGPVGGAAGWVGWAG
jgi:hypothetical protein